MAIYIITGKTGHGKTAYMANWARQLIKQGKRVYSNIKLYPKEMGIKNYKDIEGDINNANDRANINKKILYWQNFSDWVYFIDGVVICDEGLVYFNARKWDQLPDTMQNKFVQHRKDKVDLIFTVQHYTFIEKTLRVLCERFIHVVLRVGSARFKKSFVPRIAKAYEFELPALNRAENMGIDIFNQTQEQAERANAIPLWTEWFWIRKKIMTYYDTSVQVLPSRPEPLQHFTRKCAECGKIEIRHA